MNVLLSFISNICKVFCVKTEHQAETEFVRAIKKSYKQEDLILDMANLIHKYMDNFSAYDKMRAKCYLSKIKKVN